MFDLYQRVGVYNAIQDRTTWQSVVTLSELPEALVKACHVNATSNIRLGGGHPDWDGLIESIHTYCKTQYGFDGNQLNIKLI